VARGQRSDRSHSLYIVIIVATGQLAQPLSAPATSVRLGRDPMGR
jgi:hypothetical protein